MQLFSTKADRHFAVVPWDLMQHVATYVLGALMQLLSTFGLYVLQARGALSMQRVSTSARLAHQACIGLQALGGCGQTTSCSASRRTSGERPPFQAQLDIQRATRHAAGLDAFLQVLGGGCVRAGI